MTRPVHLCRSWLFVDGADEDALLKTAPESGADVLVQELEDFTPPALRPKARELAGDVYKRWREAGYMAAVRVNPLEGDGMDDLASVMRGAPDIVGLPKVAEPAHIVLLAEAVSRCEREYGLAEGSTILWPNIELARGVIQTAAIARASPRVKACLMASEDLAADIGAERGPDGIELAYARQRFLMECVAAGVMAVDCPFTWRNDHEGLEKDTRWARRLGYKAKSIVTAQHAAIVNRVLTPSEEEVERAQAIVTAFEEARAKGHSRVEVAGSMIEMPIFHNARRLLARAKELGEANRDR